MVAFAVISDVHANLEALEAVLGELKGQEIICLGDLVDYGAEPNEVIAMIREVAAYSIIGNHDVAALTGDTSMFNPKAAMSSMWTRTKMSRESRQYLEGLKEELRLKVEDVEIYFTHGSPDDHLWEYIDPRFDPGVLPHFLDKLKVQGIGLGHTHLPYVWEEDRKVVFNPGSIGQPRDGDWRAAYANLTVDGGSIKVELRRVRYDYEKAAAKIREAGLPESHAERLATGT